MIRRQQDKKRKRQQEVRRRKLRHDSRTRALEFLALGLEDFKAGNRSGAIEACKKALRIDETCGGAHALLARLLERTNPPQAADHFGRYLQLTHQRDLAFHLEHARLLLQSGRRDQACAICQQILDRPRGEVRGEVRSVAQRMLAATSTESPPGTSRQEVPVGASRNRARPAPGREIPLRPPKPRQLLIWPLAEEGATSIAPAAPGGTSESVAFQEAQAAELEEAVPGKRPVEREARPAPGSEAAPAIKPAAPYHPQVRGTLSAADLPEPPPDTRLSLELELDLGDVVQALESGHYDDPEDYELRLASEELSLFDGFDSLLALDTLEGVTRFRHQIETVRKVLRYHRGRALLADEVGLGKTIEAGIILKEYLLRGLAERVLVLTPPSLVGQWREELSTKFRLDFAVADGTSYRHDPAHFLESHPQFIMSIDTAKAARHQELLKEYAYDLIIVDEAHRLRRRSSAAWKLVDALRSRFLLLLTATPVQNDLLELFNLITLLRPGHLKTPAQFKREYVTRGDPYSPRQREKLRELLGEVMVRNTRAAVEVGLPPRRAVTLVLEPTAEERMLYAGVTSFVRRHFGAARPAACSGDGSGDGAGDHSLDRFSLQVLQREVASSPVAVVGTLVKLAARQELSTESIEESQRLAALARSFSHSRKADALLDIVTKRRHKLVVFTSFRSTLEFLERRLEAAGVPVAVFHGGMASADKDRVIQAFRDRAQVLLSSEAGGEGRNLQFADALCNFDLPWNPMRIEQRIGRLHRIGQTQVVTIYNLALSSTVEDHLLRILDRKINLFELVVGELDLILGNLRDERDLDERVLEAWAGHADDAAAVRALEAMGDDLARARRRYDRIKELDNKLFREDYES
ncbi:MAG: SNF2-related protein [Planctomycetota bacterium]